MLRIFGFCSALLLLAGYTSFSQTPAETFYSKSDFIRVPKTDVHVHINSSRSEFADEAARDNFRLITINLDDVNEPPPMEQQQAFALAQVHRHPNKIAYATSFSIRKFNDSGWLNDQLAYMKNSFDSGAIAVKIYKVVGLSLRDKDGKIVMIDDKRFDPLIDFIRQHNISILGHLGEPKNCWMPIEKMTINGDKNYFSQNPIYHMYKHPEMPTYEQEIAARDHMLEKHPGIRFIGAHLGSLEWSVDELAKHFDTYPNMAVDMAARIVHLKYQSSKDREKVRNFIIKYQDRLLYATDMVVDSLSDPKNVGPNARRVWMDDWNYFVSDDTMTSSDFDGSFKGLKLPKSVIDKIYRLNAEKWFPGLMKKQ